VFNIKERSETTAISSYENGETKRIYVASVTKHSDMSRKLHFPTTLTFLFDTYV